MTIGHYAPHLWAHGGIASYVRRLGGAQVRAGHSVVSLSASLPADVPFPHVAVQDDDELFRQAERLGLDVLHLHKPVGALPPGHVPVLRTMHGHQGSCPSATRYLARPSRPCDRSVSTLGCALGHVVDRCGSRRPRRMARAFLGFRHERALASQVHTVAVSRFVRDQMVRAGCPEATLHTLLSPAPEPTPYRPSPSGLPHLAFLGRLVPQKGVAWLLRAFARVRVPAHLDVAGEGPQRADLEALADALRVRDRVTFHGWLGPDAAKALMGRARAVVVPSVWHEPAGLVTLEAAAQGRAVVASRVGGIPEYAGEGTALLVEPNDVEGLAEALERVTADADAARCLGRAGRARVEAEFSLPRFVADLDTLYTLAAESPAPLSQLTNAHEVGPSREPLALVT